MTGSPGVAAWIAQLLFWALLVFGWASEELSVKPVAAFVVLWLAAFFALGDPWFSPFVAVLDIVLVLIIFKGDVKLT